MDSHTGFVQGIYQYEVFEHNSFQKGFSIYEDAKNYIIQRDNTYDTCLETSLLSKEGYSIELNWHN